jgi:hypothetical protein
MGNQRSPLVAWRVAVCLLLGTMGGCTNQRPAAPSPVPGSGLRAVAVKIAGLDGPLAAGSLAPLHAVVTMSDGTQGAVTDGAVWTSDNPDVARIDAQGRLSAVAEGVATIRTAVKNASAVGTATVVMNMAGRWVFSFLPASCHHSSIPGCAGTRFTGPVVRSDSVTFVQTGDRVGGT